MQRMGSLVVNLQSLEFALLNRDGFMTIKRAYDHVSLRLARGGRRPLAKDTSG